MKLVLRNITAHALKHLNDKIPEVVILNVEVFSALFVAYCIQDTSSVETTLMLMAVDVLQMCASLFGIELLIRRRADIFQQFEIETTAARQIALYTNNYSS